MTQANHGYDAFFGCHSGSEAPFLYLEDGTTWTHGDFVSRAEQLCEVVRSHGLTAGDRVAVQVPKSPDALVLYAACLRGGFVFLPLNTAYTAGELDHFLSDSEAALLVTPPAPSDSLVEVATKAGTRPVVLADLVAAAEGRSVAPATPRTADDLAAILYTSGTTGRSKGAMLSHDNLVSNARSLVQAWQWSAGDVLLHALPIFHTHGLFVATNVTLLAGASMIFQARFDPDAVLAALPAATTMMGVPTFYTRLLDHHGLTREGTRHMRLFISGSAPLLAETHKLWQATTGHRILERYGMTETNMNTSNPYDGDRRPGTVGLPLPNVEVRITGPGREILPAGDTGMIEVRGPNVFKGYWRMPEKTAEELDAEGWFLTGDLGKLSEDGYLSIVGRQKDLVISGGYNIYPKEVEEALDALPGVQESAVIGVPHPDMGEAVIGVIVPDAGGAPDAENIRNALADQLARFKQPRLIEIVESLPRNTMGKVQKNVLREAFKNRFAARAAE